MAKKSQTQIRKEKNAAVKAASRSRQKGEADPLVGIDADIPPQFAHLLEEIATRAEKPVSEVVTRILEAYKAKLEAPPEDVEWMTWLDPKAEKSTRCPQPRWLTRETQPCRVQFSIRKNLYAWCKSFSRYSAGSVIELAILDRCRLPTTEAFVVEGDEAISEVEALADAQDLPLWVAAEMLMYEGFSGSLFATRVFRPTEPVKDKYDERIKLRTEGYERAKKGKKDEIDRLIDAQIEAAANPDPRLMAKLRQARENDSSVMVENTLGGGAENTYTAAMPRWGME